MGTGRRRFLARQLVVLALAIAAAGLSDRAVASEWTEREFARFHLLAETTAIDGDDQVLIGLQVDLQPGWIFSAQDPGDFGVAPVFDWAASRNLARALVHWPEPRRVVYSTDPPVSLMGLQASAALADRPGNGVGRPRRCHTVVAGLCPVRGHLHRRLRKLEPGFTRRRGRDDPPRPAASQGLGRCQGDVLVGSRIAPRLGPRPRGDTSR